MFVFSSVTGGFASFDGSLLDFAPIFGVSAEKVREMNPKDDSFLDVRLIMNFYLLQDHEYIEAIPLSEMGSRSSTPVAAF